MGVAHNDGARYLVNVEIKSFSFTGLVWWRNCYAATGKIAK